MKLTAFWYFLLILAVLIVFMLFMKNTPNSPPLESFVNYNYTVAPNTTCNVLGYPTNNVLKIYDNNYIDTTNGNLLRVYGAAYGSGSPAPSPAAAAGTPSAVPSANADIDHLDVINRSGTLTKYSYLNGTPTIPVQPTTVSNSSETWFIYTGCPVISQTTNNEVIYLPWDQDTYVHVIDLDQNTNACGYYIPANGQNVSYQAFSAVIPPLSMAVKDHNPNNNSYVLETTTSQKLYQILSNIFYNPSTGDLVIQNNTGTPKIYNRSGNVIAGFSAVNSVPASSTVWVAYDTIGQNMVLYIPSGQKTMISVIQTNNTANSAAGTSNVYKILETLRFGADGSLQKNGVTQSPFPANSSKLTTVKLNLADSSAAKGGASPSPAALPVASPVPPRAPVVTTTPGVDWNDYLLKTQFIPPICPACPACPSFTGTCASCGSTGGASLTPSAQYSLSDVLRRQGGTQTGNQVSNQASTHSSNQASNQGSRTTAGDVTLGIANNITELGETALIGAGGLAYAAGSGATNLLKDAGSGATNLLKDTGSGVSNFLKDTGSGVSNILQGGSGAVQAGMSQQQQQQQRMTSAGQSVTSQPQQQTMGTAGTASAEGRSYSQLGQLVGPTNPYTYNGVLTDRPGSDFLPLTTDFSKFGR